MNLILAKVILGKHESEKLQKTHIQNMYVDNIISRQVLTFQVHDRLLNSVRSISVRVDAIIEYHVKGDLKDHLINFS